MSRYESEINPLKKRFRIAAAVFLIMAMACVSQLRSKQLQEKTHAELLRAKAGLTRLREASTNRRHALETLKTLYAQGDRTSAERRIYGKIDELNARLMPDDLTISAIERKGDEISLLYSFKFNNPNYNNFLNNISYLEESIYPLTMVSAVSIAQTDAGGKNILSCSINGKILTSEKGTP